MSQSQRFYELSMPDRPLYFGDLGNRLMISGLLLESNGSSALVLGPNSISKTWDSVKIIAPPADEWWEIIRASDDPAVFELDSTGGIKAVHRKMRYQLSGFVQQKIWARDDFKCMYCGIRMGDATLSIDHFDPLELGGANNESNYLSSCRKCNKRKGSIPADQWCATIGKSEQEFRTYLANQ